MAISQHWTLIGIFEKQEQAKQAMYDLQQAGFGDDQLGFVYRDGVRAVSKAATTEPEETTTAFTGGIVGGVLGAASVLLTPVLGPSVANTIPMSTMPAVEQVMDRFQHTDVENIERHPTSVDTPGDGDQEADAMLAPALALPDETEVVTREEQKLEVEDKPVAAEITPVEQDTAPDEQRLREDEATGAVTGGIVGGVLGVTAALLIPVLGPAFAGGMLVAAFSAALGAVTGGFLGAFVALGVPEEAARHYESEFKAGRTIMTVKTDDRQQEVLNILHRHGARYANAHGGE
ncbi:MAG: hypothetical protein NVS4B7_13270 [Ktedonobacteraceae bacterium]